jgi:hypothetical protein
MHDIEDYGRGKSRQALEKLRGYHLRPSQVQGYCDLYLHDQLRAYFLLQTTGSNEDCSSYCSL